MKSAKSTLPNTSETKEGLGHSRDEASENGDTQDHGEDTVLSDVKHDYYSYSEGISMSAKPLANPKDISDFMAQKMKDLGFLDTLGEFNGKALRIGTLCAGSESPMLGMKLISESKCTIRCDAQKY